MKTKVSLFIGAIALVTLSFTFAGVKEQTKLEQLPAAKTQNIQPVGGLYADVVE